MKLVVISAFLFASRSVAAPAEPAKESTPAVHVPQGDVEGVFEESEGGAKFMAFYGIPYAKPPIGDLRFKDPEPAGPWEGVLKAHAEGNMCMQPNKAGAGGSMGTEHPSIKKKMTALVKKMATLPNVARYAGKVMTHMEEDCLFLNVYTPVAKLPVDTLLPVLVFIHGGGFVVGSGDSMIYGPQYLMDKGVVLVTLNYRLGMLGFLATNTSDAPGNAGLKDQRLALRWVQDNIRAFGGDPGKVTIYGESAGSYSVHMHVLSPSTKGLFRAAIMSSSMGPDSYGFQEDPVPWGQRLGAAHGADQETVRDPGKLVQFLRGLPAKALFDADTFKSAVTEKDMRSLSISLPFGVVAEPPSSEHPFLSSRPNDILASGDFNKVPMVVGMNEMEGSIFLPIAAEELIQKLEDDSDILIPGKLYKKLDEAKRKEVRTKIRDMYFKGQPISRATLPALVDLFGDEAIGHGVHVASRWHAKYATPEAPVYLYFFTLGGHAAVSTLIAGDEELSKRGAGHADDLAYVFRWNLLKGSEIADKESFEKGRARMLELISNFVKEGKPTPSKTATVDVEWLPAELGKERFLDIGNELVVKEDILKDRMAFWDGLFKEISQEPIYNLP